MITNCIYVTLYFYKNTFNVPVVRIKIARSTIDYSEVPPADAARVARPLLPPVPDDDDDGIVATIVVVVVAVDDDDEYRRRRVGLLRRHSTSVDHDKHRHRETIRK